MKFNKTTQSGHQIKTESIAKEMMTTYLATTPAQDIRMTVYGRWNDIEKLETMS